MDMDGEDEFDGEEEMDGEVNEGGKVSGGKLPQAGALPATGVRLSTLERHDPWAFVRSNLTPPGNSLHLELTVFTSPFHHIKSPFITLCPLGLHHALLSITCSFLGDQLMPNVEE